MRVHISVVRETVDELAGGLVLRTVQKQREKDPAQMCRLKFPADEVFWFCLSLSLVSSEERRGGRVKTEEKHRGTRTHMFLGTGCLLHACSTAAAATTQLLRTSLRIRKIIQQMYKHAVEFIQLQNETILNFS